MCENIHLHIHDTILKQEIYTLKMHLKMSKIGLNRKELCNLLFITRIP